MPDWRAHFAPIDDQGLAQYRFLERLGLLRSRDRDHAGQPRVPAAESLAILARPESVALDHGPGRVRRRPRAADPPQGGHRPPGQPAVDTATIVPLALEYPFWNDRCPEALVALRTADRDLVSDQDASLRDWTTRIEQALEDDPGPARRGGTTPRPLGLHDAGRRHRRRGRRLRSLAPASGPGPAASRSIPSISSATDRHRETRPPDRMIHSCKSTEHDLASESASVSGRSNLISGI